MARALLAGICVAAVGITQPISLERTTPLSLPAQSNLSVSSDVLLSDIQVIKSGIRIYDYQVVSLTNSPRRLPTLVGGTIINEDTWVSECLDWEDPVCLYSFIQLDLHCGYSHNFRLLTEPPNREFPLREEHFLTFWTFRPGDVNIDGAVDIDDVEYFFNAPYDWNGDGFVDVIDSVDVFREIQSPAPCHRDLIKIERDRSDFAPVP